MKWGRSSQDLSEERGGCRGHVSEECCKRRDTQKQGAAVGTGVTCSRKGEKAGGGRGVRSGGAADGGAAAEAGRGQARGVRSSVQV